ncbi:MAG: CsgG/HfaB family protein [Spirochaetales bacterium]|nr:CsgG/HfaB family protein [Spirochaetales bacterium]
MKKAIILIILSIFFYIPLYSQNLYTLDNAIIDYAAGLVNNIPRNGGIAIIAFETDRRELMEYFMDTMVEKLWEKGIRSIFERHRLEVLQTELNFSSSGEVSEETAQRIGQFTGVNTVLYGSLRRVGNNNYRIIIRATNVETAQLIFPKSYELQMDSRLAGLLGISDTSRADDIPREAERPSRPDSQPQTNQGTGQGTSIQAPGPSKPLKKIKITGFEDEGMWGIGMSIGTAFSTPGFIGTIYGTISPFKYSFLEFGCDIGAGLGLNFNYEDDKVEKYHSFYPFAHYIAVFDDYEFSVYGGLGAGYMLANYTFSTGEAQKNVFAMDFVAGFSVNGDFGSFTASIVLRTNFHVVNVKVSAGYIVRFYTEEE